MKTFVRVFIILGAIGAMALAALPALAGVGPPGADALCQCTVDCTRNLYLCKSECNISVCGPPPSFPGCVSECNDTCGAELIACIEACPLAVCGNGVLDPGERCEPPGSLCSPLRICDANCRCTIPVGGP